MKGLEDLLEERGMTYEELIDFLYELSNLTGICVEDLVTELDKIDSSDY